MSKGFESASADEIKVAIAVKRLLPSARRSDIHAFCDGVREMQNRYGKSIGDEAMRQVFEQFPKLATQAFGFLPEEMRQQAYDAAIEIVAEVLEDAGLQLECCLRVSERGIAVTKAALQAIDATGFPDLDEFGEGNPDLDGVGLTRIPNFWHPLSHIKEEDGEHWMNSWAAISMMISVAQGWDTDGDPALAKPHLKQMVFAGNPTIDFDKLCYRARYDDRALLQLANAANAGFEAMAKVDR